ncbi:AAA family ATPase [Streptomyces sp. NPDC101175]|uniref:AAA family ATPase n=1 Tax=Streptomyces sp. NPDC101175 TaxID=3366123 RepID=UPI0038334556
MTDQSMSAWLVRGGTTAIIHRSADELVGRQRELHEIHDFLHDPDGPRAVLVRGERGSGRSALLRLVGERLRAEGTTVLTSVCVNGDGDRPLLFALRLVMALERQRPTALRQGSPGHLVAEAVHAADRRDRKAMAALLTAALTRSAATPVVVTVDDAQHADADSLDVLGEVAPAAEPHVGLLLATTCSAWPRRTRRGDETCETGETGEAALERLGRVPWARSVLLPRLGPDETIEMVVRRLRATPDTGLARRIHPLTRGVPGAIDALLAEWTRQEAIRVADGHAFLAAGTPTPVLPDDDRFVTALDTLGEPCGTVAAALSVLWPLGRAVPDLVASSTGLAPDAVVDSIRDLVEAEVLDELPDADGSGTRGWTFRVPLTEHTVRERMGPLRGRVSTAAVEVLWAARDTAEATPHRDPLPELLDEADHATYLPERIVDAGSLVDRERAIHELTVAADGLRRGLTERTGLRWLQAAAHLAVDPAVGVEVLRLYARAAYRVGDYTTARRIGEALLPNTAGTLTALELQEAACLVVATACNNEDWQALSRMAEARWWDELPLPAEAAVAGQVLALCRLARWPEAVELCDRTAEEWGTDVHGRAAIELFRSSAECAIGRPERLMSLLAPYELADVPPDKAYTHSLSHFDRMLNCSDLTTAERLLAASGIPADTLPPVNRFLWNHLRGRWEEALESARRMLAENQVVIPTADHWLLPARTAAILLARGRPTSAGRLINSVRVNGEGPPEYALDGAEAEVLRTLGDLAGAEERLRRALTVADARGQIQGTEELWAPLAELLVQTGRGVEAAQCLEQLDQVADRMGGGRPQLLSLLASARVLRQTGPTAHGTVRERLRDAVELARLREQPFETAVAFLTAAELDPDQYGLLHEAYELFGVTGAALWRFRTRNALREAGLSVPGRKQATAESEHLLATLIAEGLSNRQIATVLRLSEDAVANRLTRLFVRTGLKSRTEVVTAVLTGWH